MLNIYDDVLSYIKDLFPSRTGAFRIGRDWHVNRFIQVSTPLEDNNVHYEYLNGHVELHFEGDSPSKYKQLIDFLIKSTENREGYEWDYWDLGLLFRNVAVIESKAQLGEVLVLFIKDFDELISSQFINSHTQNVELGVKDTIPFQDYSVDLYIKSLKEVICLPLSIPDYQRIYCWEEYNVKSMLNDILIQMERADNRETSYRLGSIILHRLKEKYDIIDGQQRLITIALILENLGVKTALLEQKLDSREAQRYVSFNKYLISIFVQKRIQDRQKFVDTILNHIEFSVLVLQNASIDLAYTFFSNENSRGVGLTDYDLLKAHHLRFIPQAFEQQAKKAAETWNRMIQRGWDSVVESEYPDYIKMLDTYIYRLRRWMRKAECDDSMDRRRIKREYEAAPIIEEIPPFGEEFYFNEPIQGGSHFFSFVEHHLIKYNHFVQTDIFKVLHRTLLGGTTIWYRDAIEAVLFGYYLKFGELCLADAELVIMQIILQHRYENGRTQKASIMKYVGDKELVLMIDQATSPTFFLAEAWNLCREMPVIYLQDLKPVQKDVKYKARLVRKQLDKDIVIELFKIMNI